ncbi:DUF1214 domain-containing protein [Myxococcota bacterium]|nr:DUF1214 domain-containing protein [Myxococcota bacterium]
MIRYLYWGAGGAALLFLGGVLGYWLSDGITDLRKMFMPSPPKTEASAAWNDFSQRMGSLGHRILEKDFPSGTDRDRAEGIQHLTHVILEGLRWEFEHGGPDPASLMISNTDSTSWGAPNVDNKNYRARIDGASTYRLHGNVKSLHEIAVQTTAGDMHQGKVGTSETVDLSQLTIDADGNFVLTISPEPQEGDWLRQGEDHVILSIRTYFANWETTESGKFHLVKEGREGVAPEPLTEMEAAARLGRAASWIEANIVGWNRWFGMMLGGVEDNQPIAPRLVEGGSTTLVYGGIPLRLEDGMALVIEIEDPQAEYFSFQTYRRGWYHPGDYANRQTSLNQHQIHRGSDGKIRFVASAEDPGVPNWLDTEGRSDGFIAFRYIKAKHPQLPEVTLVTQAEVASFFPADTPRVSASERRATIAMRQRHVQHRFHN